MTATFTMTRNQIIHKAYRKAGITGEGDEPSADMQAEAADNLNLIIKGLERYRRKLWALEDLVEPLLAPDRINYNGKSYVCQITHTASEEHLPDVLDDYWVEIEPDDKLREYEEGVDYTGSSFLVDANTTAIERAHVVEHGISCPVELMNRFDESRLPVKTSTGIPTQLYFNRATSRVYLFPVPNRALALNYTRIRLLNDLNAAGGFPDVPVTLLAYLIYELAAEIAEEFDRERPKIDSLRNKAQMELAMAIRNQKEYTDLDTMSPAY